MKKILALAMLAVTVATGCGSRTVYKTNGTKVVIKGENSAVTTNGGIIVGSGNFITKDIAVSNFSYIQLSGSPDVVFTQKSGAPSVSVYAEDNIIDLLDIRVSGNTLYIGFKSNTNFRCNGVAVNVTAENLDGLSLSGSGKISVPDKLNAYNFNISVSGSGGVAMNNVTTGHTSVSISGSGSVSLSGNTNSAAYSITGSGAIRAQNFIAKNVDAKTTGSGNIDCYATDNIKTNSVGSGKIRYSGNPKVN